MTYPDLIQRLYSINVQTGVKLGLENMLRLCACYKDPQNSFKSVHIAGTNGNGSTSTKIAKALSLSGYKVGLFTSPHISSFRERIQINGELISEDEVAAILQDIFQVIDREKIPATIFEIITLLALLHFKSQNIDVAVFEVGLGGKLDATNILQPILSVITSISLDHTHILGDTIDAIAIEKGGIIKKNTPLVLGHSCSNLEVLHALASEKNAPVYISEEIESAFYDAENTQTARLALDILKEIIPITQDAYLGLKARPKCRLEVMSDLPLILDVAHNPEGFHRLFASLQELYSGKKIRLLLGMSKDKDYKTCLQIALENCAEIHLVKPDSERGLEPSAFIQNIAADKFHLHSTIKDGLAALISHTCKGSEIAVACGSFFIMDQIRQSLGIIEPRDIFSLNEQFTAKK